MGAKEYEGKSLNSMKWMEALIFLPPLSPLQRFVVWVLLLVFFEPADVGSQRKTRTLLNLSLQLQYLHVTFPQVSLQHLVNLLQLLIPSLKFPHFFPFLLYTLNWFSGIFLHRSFLPTPQQSLFLNFQLLHPFLQFFHLFLLSSHFFLYLTVSILQSFLLLFLLFFNCTHLLQFVVYVFIFNQQLPC